MANIIERNKRRNRIQFTVGRGLYAQYEENQQRAKKLQVILDFSRDFERWLATQMEQVARDLRQLEEADALPSASI